MNIKKLFLLSLILLTIIIFQSLPVMADPVTDQLFVAPYQVMLNDSVYELSFMRGPFGPGYAGLVILTAPGGFEQGYSFVEDPQGSGLIMISDLGNFYFSGTELVWVESTFLMLEARIE